MKQYQIIFFAISLLVLYASCTKHDDVIDYFPFGCYVESTRNGDLRNFSRGGFGFYDRVTAFNNPFGDSILNVHFYNNIKGTNIENIYIQLAKEREVFEGEYDLNKRDTLRNRFRFIFDERYLSRATYMLDSTYPNRFELTFISEDKKQIKGKFDFRVVMTDADKEWHSSWAPDTIHHSQAVFLMNYFE